MNNKTLINFISEQLKAVRNIKAIVLGGSYAIKVQRIDSDIDIGLYYKENKPLDISDLRKLANKINNYKNPAITDPGGWGRWVNGGAWLNIKNQQVDIIYRNLDFVSKIIDECLQGEKQSDYYQQPAYGFHSYIYCAEIKFCEVLYDPYNYIKDLKAKVEQFPLPLKEKIINTFLWDAEFTLRYAKKCAKRGEIYIVSGCLTRVANDLVQALYAINEEYFIGDKRSYKDITKFKKSPQGFLQKIEGILSSIGDNEYLLMKSILRMEEIFNEIIILAGKLYKAGELYKSKL